MKTQQEIEDLAKAEYPMPMGSSGYAYTSRQVAMLEQAAYIKGFIASQEMDKWIGVENPPLKIKPNIDNEIYVLASEDEDMLTVEKVWYDIKNNKYWIPFTGIEYMAKYWANLPTPPQIKSEE